MCDGTRSHLPIEGSSPGIGNRAKASAASGAYQEPFCVVVSEVCDEFYCTPTEKYYKDAEDEVIYGEDEIEESGPYEDYEEEAIDEDYEPSIAPAEGQGKQPDEPEPRLNHVVFYIG